MAAKQVNAQQMGQNWVKGMSTAGPKYAQGVKNAVAAGVNPMALAAAASAKYLQKVTEAVNSGRYAARLNSVTPQFWASQAASVGVQNLSTGATKGTPKYNSAAAKLAPVLTAASAAAAAVPDDGGKNMGKISAALDVIMAAKGTIKG